MEEKLLLLNKQGSLFGLNELDPYKKYTIVTKNKYDKDEDVQNLDINALPGFLHQLRSQGNTIIGLLECEEIPEEAVLW